MLSKLKHTLVKVSDLNGQVNVPVMFKETTIPVFELLLKGYNNPHKYGPYVIPSQVVLKKVNVIDNSMYNGKLYQVNFIGNKSKYEESIYVSSELEVAVLTGLTGKKLLKKQQEFILKDLKNNLFFSGKIGADPEVFVEDNKETLIPAYEFLGSKKDTKVITDQGKRIYWDGFQAEFETDARHCNDEHTGSIWRGLHKLMEAARNHNPKAKLSDKTVMQIPEVLLDKAKDEHVSLGCMPSFNVYKDELELPKINPRSLPYRSAGGHIHFGCGKLDEKRLERIVKGLDAILGVACVSLFQKYDNPARRKMYGRAGEYRTPPHGLEYRTLSNAWMFHPTMTYLTFDMARKAFMFADYDLMDNWKATEEEVRTCINNCDVELAQKILARNKEMFCKLIESAYTWATANHVTGIYDLYINGMHTIVDTTDIMKNWKDVLRVSNQINNIVAKKKIA